MIKKLVLNLNTVFLGGVVRLQFVTKVDGNWEIFDIGNTITNSIYEFITNKMTVISDPQVYYGSTVGPCFLSPGGKTTFYSEGDYTWTIEFNEPLTVLQGFYYYTNGVTFTKITAYDEYDNLIYKRDDCSDMIVGNADDYQSALEANYFLEIPELQVMKAYPIGVVGTIETNDSSRISNIYQIDAITVTQTEPDETNVRYLLSFDGRNTYKTYKDGLWSIVDTSSIIEQGMSKDELEALSTTEFNTVLTENRTMDILIGMTTQSEIVSPTVSSVKVLYLNIV